MEMLMIHPFRPCDSHCATPKRCRLSLFSSLSTETLTQLNDEFSRRTQHRSGNLCIVYVFYLPDSSTIWFKLLSLNPLRALMCGKSAFVLVRVNTQGLEVENSSGWSCICGNISLSFSRFPIRICSLFSAFHLSGWKIVLVAEEKKKKIEKIFTFFIRFS